MATYWVSQERYYCKYCKVWLSNHQASIRNHDRGRKHMEIVDEFFRKKREDKLKGAKSETDLKQQMEDIHKAALRAHQKDLGASSDSGVPPPPPPPPPPGVPPPGALRAAGGDSNEDTPPPPPPGGPPGTEWASETPPPPPPPPLHPRGKPRSVKEEAGSAERWNGVIQDRDRWYLDGRVHQEKLTVNSPCQIFVTPEGQWVDAVVLAVGDGGIANGSARRFDVAYFEAGAEKETVSNGTDPSTLRLPAGEGGTWPPPPEKEALPPPPPPDENTGLGGWQTVSVRMVDEAAVATARLKKKEVKAGKKARREAKAEREMMLMQAMDADDAMASYDPWGTGKYRGFDMKQETLLAPDEVAYEDRAAAAEADGGGEGGGGVTVAFKKRKGPAKGKFRKKARTNDDEDDE